MTAKEKEIVRQKFARRYNFLNIWSRRYSHMKARQLGVASHQSNGAKGKPICTLEEFMEWCMDFKNLQDFLTIYFDWAANGFTRWDSPSIDRVNPKLGYTLDNLQWLSFGDNCAKNNKDPIDHRQLAEVENG